ncbi:sulfate permease [Rhodococcus sp. I2R]|uniref:sulfate permease n=1 Tax=Rhodococcus sp. I2R TaxID=2855445 RepID=UPI001E55744A|nr:sulfate permease [Rhodococcus sp. I2R]MCC8927322.1 sulfate permease [Rhodococcus sp. I2R]
MIRLIWALSAHARYYPRRYMPTNRLLDAIRRRHNLKWGIPAMLLAVPYLLIASICTNAFDQGAPGWLHLVALWSVWNAMKFIIMGPISLVLLVRARIRVAGARRRDRTRETPKWTTRQREPTAYVAAR